MSLQSYGRTSRAIILTTTGGRRVRLSVPVSGGMIPDPECPAKFAQIRGAWQDATDRTGPEADTRFIRPSNRILLAIGITMQIIAVMVVVSLASSSAFRAYEGWGKLGRFTAIEHTCPQPACTWYGTFVADDYSARNALLGPGGPVITDGQPVTIPASSTGGQPVTIPADMTSQPVTVPAIDTGAPNIVYPAGGGTAWHAPAEGIAAAGAVFLVVLAAEITWLVRTCRRHRRARTWLADFTCPS